MTKTERIQQELDKLNQIYKDLPKQTYKVMEPLIENAAFMKVTLEDLAKEIQRTGAVEDYQNGANQKGRKQAAALQAYDRIIKDYNAVMKTLSAKLPTVVREYVIQKPWEPEEKTPEERMAEIREHDRKTCIVNRDLAKVHLQQLEYKLKIGNISKEAYEKEAEKDREMIQRAENSLQRLDEDPNYRLAQDPPKAENSPF